jgi:hypothetical protein
MNSGIQACKTRTKRRAVNHFDNSSNYYRLQATSKLGNERKASGRNAKKNETSSIATSIGVRKTDSELLLH